MMEIQLHGSKITWSVTVGEDYNEFIGARIVEVQYTDTNPRAYGVRVTRFSVWIPGQYGTLDDDQHKILVSALGAIIEDRIKKGQHSNA